VGSGDVVTANVSVGRSEGIPDHSSQPVVTAGGDTVSVKVTVTVAALGQRGAFQSFHCDDVGLGEVLVITAKVMVGREVLDCEKSQSLQCDNVVLGGLWVVTAKVMVGKEVLDCGIGQSFHCDDGSSGELWVVTAKVMVGKDVLDDETSQSFQCDDVGLGKLRVVTAKVMVGKEVLEESHSCHSICTGVGVGFVVVDEGEIVHSAQLKSVAADVLVVTAYSIVGNVDGLDSLQGIQTVMAGGSCTVDEVTGGAAALVTANAAVVGISVVAGFHSFHTDSTVLCESAAVVVVGLVMSVGA
jgi:hypothetical protein